jgi:hypothetical protein
MEFDKSNSAVNFVAEIEENKANKQRRPNIPMDLFLRYYFLQRKKEFTGEERALLVDHVYRL